MKIRWNGTFNKTTIPSNHLESQKSTNWMPTIPLKTLPLLHPIVVFHLHLFLWQQWMKTKLNNKHPTFLVSSYFSNSRFSHTYYTFYTKLRNLQNILLLEYSYHWWPIQSQIFQWRHPKVSRNLIDQIALVFWSDLVMQLACTIAIFALSFFSVSFVLNLFPLIISGISCDERTLVKRFIGPPEFPDDKCWTFGFNHECANGFVMPFNCEELLLNV